MQSQTGPERAPKLRRVQLNSRVPLVVLLLLVVNQIFNPARVWASLILAFGAVLVFSYLWARGLRDGLGARRVMQGTWVVAGDILAETFVVENDSALPALWVEVIDHSDLPGYQPDWVASVSANGQQSYETKGRCQHRGVFTLGPWELRAGDPLGIFTVIVEIPDTRSILVYPRAMVLPDLHLPRGEAPGTARTHRPTQHQTTTVASVRPYVPGDPLRAIHWRHTARRGDFMVKEFDNEPSGDLWLVLDVHDAVQAGKGAESTLEYAITLAASLVTQMLGENRRVGLATQGHLVQPQASQLQLWRILEVLAHVKATTDAPLADLLRGLRHHGVGRGRTVVVITPSTEPEWVGELLYLAGQGNAPAALLLDAASFDVQPAEGTPGVQDLGGGRADGHGEPGPSAAGLRGLLAEHGVPTHVIDRSFVFRPVVQIKRTRTELRTLGAFGRVIAVEVEEVL